MARVLVIDDDAGLLQMVKLMLEREGHQPILAEGGQAGIQAAFQQTPDLAVIDLMMPGISGYDVTRQLRANSSTAELPILILTARSQPMDKQMALNAGANAFMSKPVSSRELTTRIAEILSESSDRSDPAADSASLTLYPEATAIRRPIGATPAPLRQVPNSGPGMTPPTFKLPEKQLPVLAVLALQTGSGGTTLAINLTFILRRTLERLCLVDLNMVAGHISPYLHLPMRTSWADLLPMGDKIDPRAIGTIITPHPQQGVGVIGSPIAPPPRSLSADAMVSLLGTLTLGFQSIVLDINSLTPASIATLIVARTVIVLVSDEPAAVQNAPSLIQTLHALGIDLKKVRLVVNRNRPEPGVSAQTIATASGLPLSAELPFDVNQVQALRRGMPTVVMAPESAFAVAIQQLSRVV